LPTPKTNGLKADLRDKAQKARAEQEDRLEKARWHDWTTADGLHTTEAYFLKVSNGVVHLKKRDGTIIQVPKEAISGEDLKWINRRGWEHIK